MTADNIAKERNICVEDVLEGNHMVNFALVFEAVLAYALVYKPALENGFNMHGMRFSWWFCALPFAVIIFAYDETRRFFIRKYPSGWVQQEAYY